MAFFRHKGKHNKGKQKPRRPAKAIYQDPGFHAL